MSAAPSPLGLRREDLDTPALLVDLDAFEANVEQLVRCCRAHGVGWRPHSKSHKCPDIARIELDAGAVGVTCAKLSEAEVMVARGIGPILVANQIVTPGKLARLAALQRQQEVIASIDSAAVVEPAARAAEAAGVAIPVVIEVNVGMDRSGVEPGQPVVDLARAIAGRRALDFRGLMAWEGHVLAVTPAEAKLMACREALARLVDSRDRVVDAGIEVAMVSAGGTGCYEMTAAYPGITEIQAGGGVFMDAMYRDRFSVGSLQCALTVLATVTSRSTGHVVVDAGFKTMSAFHQPPLPLGRDDLQLRYLSAEHGIFDICEGRRGPSVGEQVEFLVGYSDSTNFLHDRFLALRDGRVERVWELQARGMLT